MPFSWFDKTVTVLRAPVVQYGMRSERDWSQATSRTVRECILVRPASSTDWRDPARTRAIDKVLIAPYGSDIREGDRISYGGRTYEVDGIAEDRESPTGAVSHMRAALVAWSG